MPAGNMIAITPVCPHSLSARPWVIGAADSVRIVSKQSSKVFVDGDLRGKIPATESVFIKTSNHTATIMRTVQVNSYATLRKKKLL
jgi:NAD+ kinase